MNRIKARVLLAVALGRLLVLLGQLRRKRNRTGFVRI